MSTVEGPAFSSVFIQASKETTKNKILLCIQIKIVSFFYAIPHYDAIFNLEIISEIFLWEQCIPLSAPMILIIGLFCVFFMYSYNIIFSKKEDVGVIFVTEIIELRYFRRQNL